MYTPKSFQAGEEDAFAFIAAHPFGLLLTRRGDEPVGGHVPFLLSRSDAGPAVLTTHVARANRQWRDLAEDGRVLVVFTGPHAYVSPRWYPEPAAAVPTWNYQAVHVRGRAEIMDTQDLLAHLAAAAAHYESDGPWRLADMDPAAFQPRLQAIVGLRVTIETVTAKFKLSQNKTGAQRRGISRGLRRQHDPDSTRIADLMDRLPDPDA